MKNFHLVMMVKCEFVVVGRKQPLTVIRENFLKSHASYMRKMSNVELSKMSREELIEKLVQINAVFSDADDKEVIKGKLKEISHTRHLKIWHNL